MVVVSSTFAAPCEGVLLEKPSTKLLVNDQEFGTATLYITENNVVWGGGVLASGTSAPTITLQYPTISLHAIQREPSPALYMVLNYELRLPELNNMQAGEGDAVDEDFDPDEVPITQLRFIPESDSDLQLMYSAMSEGQSLHPDPQDEVDQDDYMDGEEYNEGEEEFVDAEESNAQPEDAASRLRHLHIENSNGGHCNDADEDAEVEESNM